MIDRQTMVAITRRWTEEALDDVVPGSIDANRPDPRPTTEYAVLKCARDRSADVSKKGRIDYRRVSIELFGLNQETLADKATQVDAAFADDEDGAGMELDFTGFEGVSWMRTERVLAGGDTLEIVPEMTQQGQWWKLTLSYVVWTSRNNPTGA